MCHTSDLAASICPGSIALIPERMISAIYAAVLIPTTKIPALKAVQ